MSEILPILKIALLILAVVLCFNVIIFVHELGHFLAAKWRGLQVDRFQIWFGAPIWKKEIKGVQYGLGWIPAGGFVSLPQMAPMESLEGETLHDKPLPPVKPIDKIIVALAGPAFSMLLALLAATVVWKIGKPADSIPTQTIGEVVAGLPAEKAGLRAGDKILAVNGAPVNGFGGALDSIMTSIALSRGDKVEFTVERAGESAPLKIVSGFEIEKTKWYQRTGMRKVGILPMGEGVGAFSIVKNSPAERAGFKDEDKIISVNGRKFSRSKELKTFTEQTGAQPLTFEILRAGKPLVLTATPVAPVSPSGAIPMLGMDFYDDVAVNQSLVYPTPSKQVTDSLKAMWRTITSVVARDSSVGIGHLSGPVGIGRNFLALLQTDEGIRRVLAMMVLFNVNLAVLNMLPFPVLDGGHVVLALLEKMRGRPVKARPLEIIQTFCALLLMGLMLYITSKDATDGMGKSKEKTEKIVFPAVIRPVAFLFHHCGCCWRTAS